ncbi:MAG: 5,6-dimethylbenzimidazole synthase [Sphingobacteriales bacterium]|nr:MAG: 5,6-dimethylbenzimidazole synthase [Sphingobacteriales bacterium]
MDLFEAIIKRRDTRHFTNDIVPDSVLKLCLEAANNAPSVGLTQPSRFIFVDSLEKKQKIYDLFLDESNKALAKIKDEKRREIYKGLQLQAILEAPLGLIICSDHSTLKDYTIGVQSMKETIDWSVCCAIQNFWLALTAQGFSLGWVSITNSKKIKKIMNIPEWYKPLGYFCIGKPATNYDNMPMLKQKGWLN